MSRWSLTLLHCLSRHRDVDTRIILFQPFHVYAPWTLRKWMMINKVLRVFTWRANAISLVDSRVRSQVPVPKRWLQRDSLVYITLLIHLGNLLKNYCVLEKLVFFLQTMRLFYYFMLFTVGLNMLGIKPNIQNHSHVASTWLKRRPAYVSE